MHQITVTTKAPTNRNCILEIYALYLNEETCELTVIAKLNEIEWVKEKSQEETSYLQGIITMDFLGAFRPSTYKEVIVKDEKELQLAHEEYQNQLCCYDRLTNIRGAKKYGIKTRATLFFIKKDGEAMTGITCQVFKEKDITICDYKEEKLTSYKRAPDQSIALSSFYSPKRMLVPGGIAL